MSFTSTLIARSSYLIFFKLGLRTLIILNCFFFIFLFVSSNITSWLSSGPLGDGICVQYQIIYFVYIIHLLYKWDMGRRQNVTQNVILICFWATPCMIRVCLGRKGRNYTNTGQLLAIFSCVYPSYLLWKIHWDALQGQRGTIFLVCSYKYLYNTYSNVF